MYNNNNKIHSYSDFHKMTVTVLKTEFVKADPIQINYRDYKNFNIPRFNEDLRNKLISDGRSNSNYNRFQNILREVLNKHAPMKKKYKRANNSSKNKTVENWEKYRKLRNELN